MARRNSDKMRLMKCFSSPTLKSGIADPRRRVSRPFGALLIVACGAARAALPDEIQVYDDSINKPGEWGLELHLNTTPIGQSAPAYPGETVAEHGVRGTLEFSRGLSPHFEAGLYLPTVYDPARGYTLAGIKARLKWIALSHESSGGPFAGVNAELGHVERRFEQATDNLELRTMLGTTSDRWLLAVNPTFEVPLNAAARGGAPDLAWQMRALRRFSADTAAGFEYYAEAGPLDHLPAVERMPQTLYAVLETPLPGRLDLHVGMGYGWAGADRLTIKMIIGMPL